MNNIYTEVKVPGWERVVWCENEKAKLKAYIAIHDTKRGPGLGGCRMWPYNANKDALTDVLRLSEGMTYKAIWAKLPLGGGKSCIIGDSKIDKTDALFEAMGDFVNYMDGNYIIAEDVGTTLNDIKIVSRQTEHITSIDGGDPSPMTAYACFRSIEDTYYWKCNVDNISNIKVGVLGLGKVGYALVKHLINAGALVFGSDIDQFTLDKVKKENPTFVACSQEDLINMELDVFAPCALGGIIDNKLSKCLKTKIVAGSANNQLLEPIYGDILHSRGILYAPDYVINAGGLINVYCEVDGPYKLGRAKALAGRVSGNLINIYERATKENKPTYLVADEMAKEILNGKKEELSI